MMNSSFTGSSADSSASDASFRDGDSDKESISSIRSDDGDRLIWKSKQEFNRNRKIIIKNIPPVTYEEVKEFLKGCSINTISISKKSRRAIVTLLQGEDAETICESLSGSTLFDTTVIVEPYHHEHMLCISHLPSTVNHRQFKKFLTQYGAMERCFLMYESDGKCKGYGFVEYMHNREKVATVMQLLHGLPFPRLDGALSLESAGIQNSIQCHFLHDHVITYDDLQSTSLLIGQLPCTFNDESSLKELFSQQDVPCHFELLHIDEKQLVYGFAQYVSSVSAEKTWMFMNGYELSHNNGDAQSHHLDVSFCTPGQTRDDVYNNIVNSLCTKKTPPSLMSVPVLPPNLMSTLGPPPLPHTLLAPPLYPPPSLLMPPPPVVNPLRPNNSLVPSEPTVWICPVVANLLATTPHLLQSFEVFLEELYYSRVNANMYGEESLNDSNVQIALLAMLLSMQIQESQPALLQNPLIQTWSNNPQLEKTVKENINQNRPTLQGHPVLTHANSLLQDLMYSRCHTAMYHQQAARPIASAYNRRTPATQDIATSGSDVADVPQSSPTEPEQQPVQLKETPSLKPDTSMSVDEDPAVEKAVPSLMGVSVPPVIPSLLDGMPDLSVPPPPIPETPANPALAVFFEKQILHQLKLQKDQPPVSSQSASTTNIVPLMEKSAYVVSNIRNVPSASLAASNLGQISSDTGAATNRENPGQPSPTFSDTSSLCSNVSTPSNTTDGVQKCGTLHRPVQDSNKRKPILGSHGSDVNSQLDAVEYQVDEEEDAKDNTFVTNLMQSMSKFYGEQSTSTEKPSSPSPSECMPDIFSYMDNLGVLDIQNLTSPPGIKGKSRLDSDNSDGCFTPVRSLLVTPIGQKRRGGIPHLVPSPEESPEGSYIGQHSQGLGGHYAESYLKRRRLNTADNQ